MQMRGRKTAVSDILEADAAIRAARGGVTSRCAEKRGRVQNRFADKCGHGPTRNSCRTDLQSVLTTDGLQIRPTSPMTGTCLANQLRRLAGQRLGVGLLGPLRTGQGFLQPTEQGPGLVLLPELEASHGANGEGGRILFGLAERGPGVGVLL